MLDASDPQIKHLAKDIFIREFDYFSPSNLVIEETNKQLENFGYHQQIKIQNSRPNLFLLENGRHSIEIRDKRFFNLATNQSFDCIDLVKTHPEKFSPKVVLRPIVQDYFPYILLGL